MRRRKGTPKKPLGRKAALEAMALQLADEFMKIQAARGTPSPFEHGIDFDGGPDLPKYVSLELEAKRRSA